MDPSRSPNAVTRTAPASTVVIGGGLAGLAAAVRLAEAGVAVTLVETRQRLGGRATSFVDPTTGELLDNCQHVLLGCCTNLIDLYRRLGVLDQIEWHRRLYFADGRGRLGVLEGDDLPAPLHTTRSLLAMPVLSLREKLAIARGMIAVMRVGREGRRRLGDVSFAQWLVQQRQPQSAIDRFWAVIVISACNELPERVAARYALQVFQDGFLNHRASYVMGLPRGALVSLYDPAKAALERAGGRILLSESASQLLVEGGRVTALGLADGRTIAADAFVSAVPFDRLGKLVADARLDPRLARLAEHRVSPIIGVHLFLDRPVMDQPHLILMDSPLQWIFNKGRTESGQHLHGVISAAHDLVEQPADAIADLTEREMRQALRIDPTVTVRHRRVVKEKRATFSVRPGIDAARPPAAPPTGGLGNLFLAGDWTDTGWPATMEGAVRSGYAAASALLHAPLLVDDLPDSTVYHLLAGP